MTLAPPAAPAGDGAAALLAALPGQVAVIAPSGAVLAVNAGWRQAGATAAPRAEVGRDYLAACASARGEHAAPARAIAAGLRRVLAGHAKSWSLDHARAAGAGERRFRIQVSALVWQGKPAALLTHTDISPAPRSEPAALQVVEPSDLQIDQAGEGGDGTSGIEALLRLNAGLERRVQRRTRQLEAANRELEAFSYSVSHDLKAPLAAIDGFVHVLTERLKDRVDAREAGYLQRVRAGVANMFALIDAMLALHQLSRGTPLQRCWVDVAALVEGIVAELREADPGRPAWVRVEPLSVYGDPALLGIALRNLVGNAWKFSAQQPWVEIEIAEQADGPGGFTTLRVSDRGAGFDPAQAHKLFAPFQRLHPASEFPGTGVGLATVQRIVQRHGGMIRAESAPGAGASFWLSLPLPAGPADTVSGL